MRRLLLSSVIWLGLVGSAWAQHECQLYTTNYVVLGQVRDAAGVVHDARCWDDKAVKVYEPLTYFVGGTVALSALTVATATNSINNASFTQTWNWVLTGANNGLVLGEASAGSGTGTILRINGLSNGVTPFLITNAGGNVASIAPTTTIGHSGLVIYNDVNVPLASIVANGNITTYSSGATFTNNVWTARATTATAVTNAAGQWQFFSNSGLTIGNTVPWIQIINFSSTGVGQAGGLKHQRLASCTTAAAANAACQTTILWTAGFADTNYTPNCTMESTTIFIQGVWTKTTAGLVVNVMNFPGSSAAGSGTLDCIAMHD